MHIIVIAWLWVILMVAITERSVTAGVLTFLFYGVAPCALLIWLIAGQRRWQRERKSKAAMQADIVDIESVGKKQVERGDGQDTKRN